MLISRGSSALRLISNITRSNIITRQAVRNGGHGAFSYRQAPPPSSKHFYVIAEIVQGVAWWWMLYHIFTEPDHIIGEFEWPDSRKWTDEELGIPAVLEEGS